LVAPRTVISAVVVRLAAAGMVAASITIVHHVQTPCVADGAGLSRPIALQIQALTMLNVPIVSPPSQVIVAALDRIAAACLEAILGKPLHRRAGLANGVAPGYAGMRAGP
jgi:hypothetical protein